MNRTLTIVHGALRGAAVVAAAGLLAACVAAPPPRPPPPPPPPVQAPPPNTDVYAYPLHSQPPEQQDRDHYECSVWATQQTGFDPSAPGVPPHDRVHVVSAGPPPGTNTAIGAVAGAIIGAAIAPRWQSAGGALAGAVVGSAIGSAGDAANAQANATNFQAAQAASAQNRRAAALQEQKAGDYRRALSACLDGRGYSVR
ncbi:MAG TPA: glycine zipper 2TM domain-containing protein [Steroidobacteraceae bacterium]|nr:glycine zipper 2TM domain-containing protein [Steroidobacteraceae bacterium]